MQKEWERRTLAQARAGLLLENEVAKQRMLLKKQMAEENKQLQEEQTARYVGVAMEWRVIIWCIAIAGWQC